MTPSDNTPMDAIAKLRARLAAFPENEGEVPCEGENGAKYGQNARVEIRNGREHVTFDDGSGSPPYPIEEAKARARRMVESGDVNYTIKVLCETEECGGVAYESVIPLTWLKPGQGLKCPRCMRGLPPRFLEKWRNTCPREFREGEGKTTRNHPNWPAAIWDEIKDWQPGVRTDGKLGLFLYGDTGVCKSRMLHFLAYKLIVQEHRDCEVLRGVDFRQKMTNAYNLKKSDEVLDRLKTVPVLLWDDFGQDSLSQGTISDLWSVVDHRYSEGMPTVISSNFPVGSLPDRLASFNENSRPQAVTISSRIDQMCKTVLVPKNLPKNN